MLACESYKPNVSDIDQTLKPFDCSLPKTEPAPSSRIVRVSQQSVTRVTDLIGKRGPNTVRRTKQRRFLQHYSETSKSGAKSDVLP